MSIHTVLLGVLGLTLLGCGTSKAQPGQSDRSAETGTSAEHKARIDELPIPDITPLPVPPHLENFGDLYVRVGDEIVDAPPELEAAARRYVQYPGKGDLVGGLRLTILTAETTVKVGQEVVVIHVCEATEPGIEVFVMGPKRVHGEYVDGKLNSAPWKGLGVYDGAVLSTPTADANYDLTIYSWDQPGTHTIQWRHGGTTCEIAGVSPISNTLTITVVE